MNTDALASNVATLDRTLAAESPLSGPFLLRDNELCVVSGGISNEQMSGVGLVASGGGVAGLAIGGALGAIAMPVLVPIALGVGAGLMIGAGLNMIFDSGPAATQKQN